MFQYGSYFSQAEVFLHCVFPRYGYVCASKTMALRRLLEAANSDTGFTNQEKGVCLRADIEFDPSHFTLQV